MFTKRNSAHLPAAGMALCLVISLVFGFAALSLADDDAEVDRRMAEAREALNESRFERAAALFAEVFEARQSEMEAGDALYWEAFARYRLDKTSELKAAARLLALQQEEYASAAMALEGEALAARVVGELAERGEALAAREIFEWASEEEARNETRVAALQSLMQMDSARAMPVLKKIVLDSSPKNRDLRRNAVFIMCREGGSEAEELVIQLLKTETDPEFQTELVMCLSSTGSERALTAMIDLFRNTKDLEVAEMALFSIGRHGGDQVFEFLLQVAAAKDQRTEIRGHALLALGMTDREEEATKVLIEVLETESDLEILEMTLMALSHIDNPAAGQALMAIVKRDDVDEEFRSLALHMAARTDGVDLKLLRQVYESASSRDLKLQVCHVLTQMDEQDEALELLIEISRTEKDPEIRRDAVFWIGQFDNERAAEYLLEVINEE